MSEKEKLIAQKVICDEKLARLKATLQSARGDAAVSGRYLRPEDYANMRFKLASLQKQSQTLQAKLGKIRDSSKGDLKECFFDVSRSVLDKDLFMSVLETAHSMKREREGQ